MWVCLCVVWVFFYYARIVSTSLRYSREAAAISDTYDESARSHALAPKCRTEIDGGTMRRSVWSGKKTLRLAAVRSEDYRGVGIEREWETEGERERGKKSQGWNGAGRRPLIKIPWHIAVCYTTTIYACSIYTICSIHTHSLLPRLYIHNSLVCVRVCVSCQNPLT